MEISEVLRKKNKKPSEGSILCQLSFKGEVEIKTFSKIEGICCQIVDLPCKKCLRKSFRDKKINISQESK